MRNQFSHYIVSGESEKMFKVQTECGRWIDSNNYSAMYFDERQFAFTKPLCPKCAAARLIQEVSGGIDNHQQS